MTKAEMSRAERMYRNCQRWGARRLAEERRAFWQNRANRWLSERMDELVSEINGTEGEV